MNRPLRILISGGGTGGHIFPAIAIANALRRRYPDSAILFVGAEGRMEMQRVPEAGYEIKALPVAGFDRRRPWRNIGVLMKLWRSMRLAKKIVADFRPDIAIGVGGYASGPTLKAAQKAGVATLLQEQNGYAGVTNKLLAAKADAICVAYEGMDRFFSADKIHLTGNPVRLELLEERPSHQEAVKALGLDPEKPVVLVTGGSLGARTINRSIAAALPLLQQQGIQVVWQMGKIYVDEYMPIAKKYSNVKPMVFISDMAQAYAAADVVVARAGAGTISELQLLGEAAILIPSPNVAEDHQRHNAEALVERQAATMILDSDAEQQLGQKIVDLMGNPKLRATLSKNIREMALNKSDERIVDIAAEILCQRDRGTERQKIERQKTEDRIID